jgi:hypothetical protein
VLHPFSNCTFYSLLTKKCYLNLKGSSDRYLPKSVPVLKYKNAYGNSKCKIIFQLQEYGFPITCPFFTCMDFIHVSYSLKKANFLSSRATVIFCRKTYSLVWSDSLSNQIHPTSCISYKILLLSFKTLMAINFSMKQHLICS